MADAILLSLATGLLFGLLAVSLRMGLVRYPDAELAAFHNLFIGFGVAFLATAAAGQLTELSWSDVWPFLALGAIAPGITQMMFLFALRDIGASRTMVIYGALPLASSIGAVLFLDEPVRTALFVGTLLVVGGAVLLAYDPTKPKDYRATGLVWALSSIIFFAGRDNLSHWLTTDRDIPAMSGAATALAGGTLAILLYLLVTRRGQQPFTQMARSARPFLVSSAIFGLSYPDAAGVVLAWRGHGRFTADRYLRAVDRRPVRDLPPRDRSNHATPRGSSAADRGRRHRRGCDPVTPRSLTEPARGGSRGDHRQIRLSQGLPGHVRDAHDCRRRSGHQGRRRPGPPDHRRSAVRPIPALRRAHPSSRPAAEAARTRLEERTLPRDELGGGHRTRRPAVRRDHRRARRPGDPSVQLPRTHGGRRNALRRSTLEPHGHRSRRNGDLRDGGRGGCVSNVWADPRHRARAPRQDTALHRLGKEPHGDERARPRARQGHQAHGGDRPTPIRDGGGGRFCTSRRVPEPIRRLRWL